jgi:hypothetical protein
MTTKRKYTAVAVKNNQEAIEAHKKRMESQGWEYVRSWQYEGVTSVVNLDYQKKPSVQN